MQAENSRVNALWRAFLLLLGALSIVPNLGSLLYFLDAAGQGRFRHVELGIEQIDILPGWGSCQRVAHRLQANGVFAQAGGREGDRLCFHGTLEQYPNLTTLPSLNLTVIGVDQKKRSLSLPTAPYQLQSLNWIDAIGQPIQDILFALVGMLIGWRGAQQLHLRKLALGMLLWSVLLPFYVPAWALGSLDLIAYAAQANLLAFLGFALNAPDLRRAAAGPVVEWIRRGLPIYGLACLLCIVWSIFVQVQGWNGQALMHAEVCRFLITLTGYAALMLVLSSYRALAKGQARERIALLLPMFALSLLVQVQPGLYAFFPQLRGDTLVCLEYVLGSLLPLGLGYAVLRHRVFDLGFALNRAIFFSLFTLSLAVAIGFAEFGVKVALQHLNWLQKYPVVAPLISSLMGIGVILGFRQIHHVLEELVENLFFHDWHVALERFRKRIEAIAFVGEAPLVLQRFANALQEYAAMGHLAIYLQKDLQGGAQSGVDDFLLQWNEARAAPATLDANHLLATDLRAGVRMLELPEVQHGGEVAPDAADGVNGVEGLARDKIASAGQYDTEDAADRTARAADAVYPDYPGLTQFRLALALQLRGRVFGFVLLGPKSDGHRYRPDEIRLLCQASDSIALDLENLRVERLQQEHRQQQHGLMQLQAQLEMTQLQQQLAELKLAQQG